MEKQNIITIFFIVLAIIAVFLIATFFLIREKTVSIQLDRGIVQLTESEYIRIRDLMLAKYEKGESFTREEWMYFAGIINEEIKRDKGIQLNNFEGDKIIGATINELK